MPEAILRDGEPKSSKTCQKKHKYDGPGLHLGALWGSVGIAEETLDDFGNGLGFNLESAGSIFLQL